MRSLQRKLYSLLHEAFSRRRFVIGVALLVFALGVSFGWYWPPSYISSATIIVDDKNIIQPLMNGAAVTTDVADRARLAKEVITSRKIIGQVVDQAGVLEKGMSPVERERVMDAVRGRTNIINLGTNLIRVEYKDTDPERAFRVNSKLVEAFIAENIGTRARESESAFKFIDEQVREYQAKLASAEEGLRRFHAGAFIQRGRNDGQRGESLYTRAEQARLELKEAEIRRAALQRQLQGETRNISGNQERELRARLTTMQGQLNTLRLTYQDTYPDIVRLRRDIEEVKRAIAKEQQERGGDGVVLDEAGAAQFRQRLTGDMLQADTQIAALRARLEETERLINADRDAGQRMSSSGVTLTDLMRDHEVNQSILDDLLKRREAARVSMNLDRERQGLSFRVHDAASLPISASGPRFLHFVIGGFVLGIFAPFGLIYARQQLDERVRSHHELPERLGLPVISVVPHLVQPQEAVRASHGLQWLAILAFTVIFVILSAIFIRSGT